MDDELIYAFYDARVPEGITNGADFEKWRKEAERAGPKLLHLKREDLMRHEAAGITTENFPHELQLGPNRFALEYHFEPRSPKDGVTLTVPVALLNQVPAARCEWLVPGLLKEKVARLREGHAAAPAPQAGAARRVRAGLRRGGAAHGHAARLGAGALYPRELGLEVPADAFRPDSRAAAPAHEFPRASTSTAGSWRWAGTSPQLKEEFGAHRGKPG